MSESHIQQGGNHYQKLKIDPITYAVMNNLDSIQFSIVKYASRHDLKGTQELDLRKLFHFTLMLIKHNSDIPQDELVKMVEDYMSKETPPLQDWHEFNHHEVSMELMMEILRDLKCDNPNKLHVLHSANTIQITKDNCVKIYAKGLPSQESLQLADEINESVEIREVIISNKLIDLAVKAVEQEEPKILIVLESCEDVNHMGGLLISKFKRNSWKCRYKLYKWIQVLKTDIQFAYTTFPKSLRGIPRDYKLITHRELIIDYPELRKYETFTSKNG